MVDRVVACRSGKIFAKAISRRTEVNSYVYSIRGDTFLNALDFYDTEWRATAAKSARERFHHVTQRSGDFFQLGKNALFAVQRPTARS